MHDKQQIPSAVARRWPGACFAATAALFLCLQVLDLRVGFYFEEPRDSYAAEAVAAGKMPILDFKWLYGPVLPMLLGAIERAHAQTMCGWRFLHLGFGLVSLWACHRILRLWFTPSVAALLALCATSHFQSQVFSYTHWFFGMWGLLASLQLLVVLRNPSGARPIALVTLGILVALVLWTKPIPSGILFSCWVAVALAMAAWSGILSARQLRPVAWGFAAASLPWIPFAVAGPRGDGLQMIFDTTAGILATPGRFGGSAAASAAGGIPPSLAHRALGFLRSDAFHVGATAVGICLGLLASANHWYRHQRQSAREVLCLTGCAAALNAHSMAHPLVHFSDAGAGYSVPLTVLVFAVATLQPGRRRWWATAAWAGLFAWSALFLGRHVTRAARASNWETWQHGIMRGLKLDDDETAYHQGVRDAIGPARSGVAPTSMLLGYYPPAFAVDQTRNVLANDIFAAQRAFDIIYERSSVRLPMQRWISDALAGREPEVVLVSEQYVAAIHRTGVGEVLDRGYRPEGRIPARASHPELTVYRRR